MDSNEQAVHTANEAFYTAFERRDLAAMDALWVRAGPVCCIHPGWGALDERMSIIASWASIFTGEDAPTIRCERLLIQVRGDWATVICEEVLGDARMAATNGFVREGTRWRIWHHHASPIARRMKIEDPLLTKLLN